MKCGYKHCKLGGEVKKENSIKDGRYYHKECHNKKITKGECRDILDENYSFTKRNINIAIKQLVDDRDINPDKLKFTIKYIIKNKKDCDLNSPYGVTYYLENFKINKAFKKMQTSKRLQIIKNTHVDVDTVNEQEFKYKKGGRKSWEII
jgi:hypothetical protein